MATQKQIEANRRNAQRSTGPRTAEGKARASQNSRTHGLYSLPLPNVQDESFREYLAMSTERHIPANREQAVLVCDLALCWWERDVVDRAEHEIFSRLCEGKNSPDPAVRDAAWTRFSKELGPLDRAMGTAYERLFRALDQWLLMQGATPEDIAELHADEEEWDDEDDEFDADDEEESRTIRQLAVAAQEREGARAQFLREAVRAHFGAVAEITSADRPPLHPLAQP